MKHVLGSGPRTEIDDPSRNKFTNTDKLVAGLTGLAAVVALAVSLSPSLRPRAVNYLNTFFDNSTVYNMDVASGKYKEVQLTIKDHPITITAISDGNPAIADYIRDRNRIPYDVEVLVPGDEVTKIEPYNNGVTIAELRRQHNLQ